MSKPITDREYQTAAVWSIFEYFKAGGTGNPLVAANWNR